MMTPQTVQRGGEGWQAYQGQPGDLAALLSTEDPSLTQVLVCQCQQGDPAALGALRNRYHPALVSILLARGATRTETEDLLADVWGECVPRADGRPSLLEKFNGKCTLQGWLATVATNRWIDSRRRRARLVELSPPRPGERPKGPLDDVPTPAAPLREAALVELLHDSLRAAFGRCPAEAMVLLRLVYLHGLTQREIVRMLGWSESKVSRTLSQAMHEIKTNTLSELKQRDPWLNLTWQDFEDLCATHQIALL